MYVLERGQLEIAPQKYTYMRRAQATIHHMKWRQMYLCSDLEHLKAYAIRLLPWVTSLGGQLRITGMDAPFETIEISEWTTSTACIDWVKEPPHGPQSA